MYDVIVIGKGPSGLSASLYLSREGYKVLVLGEVSYLEKCKELNNYLGIEYISGEDYIDISTKQVINAGAQVREEKVIKLSKVEDYFTVNTDKNEYQSKSIILALGSRRVDNSVKNTDKYIGKGVSYCVSCDGYFYRDKNVGVIGSSEYAIEEALNLKNYTDKITIYTNANEMNISEKYISNLKQFSIDNRKIKSLDGDNELTHIVFEDGEKVKIDGIFIANNMPNIDELSTSLGVITKDNKIVSDENNMTNIEGVYACGDMINNFKQVSTAVGSGAIAAHSCIKYLVNLVKEEEMKVQIYTTSTCHWCRAAKEYFKNKGIKYEEFNVELDHDKAVELVNISGQRSVPVIIVDEQIIIGFDKETLDKIFDKKENK